MGINDPKVGFMTPIKKKSFKSDSSDNQTTQDKALRAKQDLQAAKERESDKSRFIKQVQGAKSNTSILTPDPYAKSTPGSNAIVNKIMAAKPETPKVEAPKPKAPVVVATPPNPNNSKYANTRDFKGDTSLDVSNPKNKSDVVSAPKAKPVVKAAPKTKSQFEKMQDAYEGFGKGSDSAANKEVQARLEQRSASTRFANPEKTSTGAGAAFAKGAKGAMKKGGSACKGYAKGGSVRSASSRGDGCATKGHTKGAMR
jgi:hypothetical protein